MDHFLVKIIIAFNMILLCAISTVSAQSMTASYKYDKNGNRIVASLTFTAIETKDIIKPDTVKAIDDKKPPIDSAFQIFLYPNPTHGNVIVQIDGISLNELSNTNNMIGVWDLQGKTVLKQSNLVSSNAIDLNAMPNGVYIMKIIVNSQISTYKIVKN